MYVFSIYIPFKGSQSLSYMRSEATAVSYLHSGVIDTAVHITAVSMIPQCRVQPSQISIKKKTMFELFAKIFEKEGWLHSGVNDTAVICTAENSKHIR
jgi:hypothetical protein